MQQTEFFVILDHFLPFCPHTDPENQNFGKMNITPEDIIYHFTNVYHKWQSCDEWFLRYEAWWTEFFVIWTNLCLFTPLTTQKINILKKWKKNSGDIIILHICTINANHIIYSSRDMKCDRQNFVILDCFLPFYPPNNPKNQNFEKLIKTRDITILNMFTINDNQMMYGSWDIESDRYFLVIFDHFLSFYPLTTQNIKILTKLKKNTWRYYHFTHEYHKLQSYDKWFLRYWAQRTEFFVILDNFLPIYPLKTRKIKI